MIEIYTCDDCNPCIEAKEWMDQHDITYTIKGMVAHIDEYPTIIVNGVTVIGWGEDAKKLVSEVV